MHSLDLLAVPLSSWTAWRTWRLKPAILAHLMRCHSRNRKLLRGVEHCFMRANGSTPSLRQLQEPGAASALAACLASSRGRGHAEAWNDSGRVCERKLESRWKFASRPQCLCVPLTRCPISRTREAPYRYRYACFGVTGQSPLLGTGSREHRPAMAFSIFAPPGAPLKLALVWNLGRYSAVQTTCICCHYQLSALLRATTKRKGQKSSFSSRRGGLWLTRHCTTARTWLW
jgi:hypothetical protein